MTQRGHTNVAIAGHVLVAVVLLIDRAGYGGRPDVLPGALANHPLWAFLHLAVAAGLLGVRKGASRSIAASASSSVMFVWAALLWWWATSLEPDATWLVGILGVIAAGHSAVLADIFARDDPED